MTAATPLHAVIQRGTRLYSRDTAKREEILAECADLETAGWLGWTISEFHSCDFVVEQAEGDFAITAKVEIHGRLDDPRFLELLGTFNDLSQPQDDIPPEVDAAVRDYLSPEQFDTYRRNVAGAMHQHGFATGRTGRAG